MTPARVTSVRLGEHDGFYLINGRIKMTFEHPFPIRRDETWVFCSAELLRVGNVLVTRRANFAHVLGEEPIVVMERILGRVRTVALRVPGTNTHLADSVWTHNDISGAWSQTATNANSISDNMSVSSSGSSSGSSRVEFPWRGNPEAAAEHMRDVAGVIREANADVVLLQEVADDAALDRLNALLDGMGYTPHFV